ncbi:hypothetical protein THAOC_36104, partial [Thalassiosira oceanica]
SGDVPAQGEHGSGKPQVRLEERRAPARHEANADRRRERLRGTHHSGGSPETQRRGGVPGGPAGPEHDSRQRTIILPLPHHQTTGPRRTYQTETKRPRYARRSFLDTLIAVNDQVKLIGPSLAKRLAHIPSHHFPAGAKPP